MASSGKGRERREHFRSRSRAGRRVDIMYSLSNGQPTRSGSLSVSAVTANIGVGGAFVLTTTPEKVGTVLRLTVILPAPQPHLEVDGEVRWLAAAGDAGMGVKFAPLTVNELRLLRDYFTSLDT